MDSWIESYPPKAETTSSKPVGCASFSKIKSGSDQIRIQSDPREVQFMHSKRIKPEACMRRSGKSWSGQVRISEWRNVTKHFNNKSNAVVWSGEREHELR